MSLLHLALVLQLLLLRCEPLLSDPLDEVNLNFYLDGSRPPGGAAGRSGLEDGIYNEEGADARLGVSAGDQPNQDYNDEPEEETDPEPEASMSRVGKDTEEYPTSSKVSQRSATLASRLAGLPRFGALSRTGLLSPGSTRGRLARSGQSSLLASRSGHHRLAGVAGRSSLLPDVFQNRRSDYNMLASRSGVDLELIGRDGGKGAQGRSGNGDSDDELDLESAEGRSGEVKDSDESIPVGRSAEDEKDKGRNGKDKKRSGEDTEESNGEKNKGRRGRNGKKQTSSEDKEKGVSRNGNESNESAKNDGDSKDDDSSKENKGKSGGNDDDKDSNEEKEDDEGNDGQEKNGEEDDDADEEADEDEEKSKSDDDEDEDEESDDDENKDDDDKNKDDDDENKDDDDDEKNDDDNEDKDEEDNGEGRKSFESDESLKNIMTQDEFLGRGGSSFSGMPGLRMKGRLSPYNQELMEIQSRAAKKSCVCGLSGKRNRIVGGVDAERNEFPWQVRIQIKKSRCGGSILTDMEILTAGHCFAGNVDVTDVTVVFADFNGNQVEAGEFTIPVCKIIRHPRYEESTAYNFDFTILRLCEPISFSTSARPICLPDSVGKGEEFEGATLTVSGWGKVESGGKFSTLLNKAKVMSMPNDKCCEPHTKYKCSQITENMLCANAPKTDSCQGDSGGPLIYKERNGHYTQVGLVSFGVGCAKAEYPGVYARVTKRLDWIQQQLTGNVCSKPY